MLRPLVTAPGPFTSVYFEDSHDTEDAAKQLELKLRDLCEQLRALHAPDASVHAIENAVRKGPHPSGRSGRALLATGGSVVVDERLTEPPAAPLTRVSDLPYLLPLTRYAEPGLKHVVAMVDQVNARVTAFDEHGREIGAEAVSTQDHPVHRTRGGGWAQYSIREHTEETIRRNVTEIAEEITRLAECTEAEMILLVGEIQGRRAVHEALPERLRGITQEVTHADVVDGLVSATKQRRLEAVLDRFRTEMGRPDGLAVQGLEGVTAALVEGNVETLLISDPGDEMVWTGVVPTQIAVTEAELSALGAAQAHQRRADEAVPVAAIAVGADLVGVDSDLTEGFGAILRHR
ncbi:Vms1/Ankzf1 family peptidyl-tRNA hydrolase [Amycolatopsis cynarae]|uniref:Vms1/Ankzf1 family peptidyl-tRNA hydrolase n=1 Tax=Amycolatopsis cynarae TaxID=2995223 RepID=A0ABY7B097_9PSEU|nr:Vms1/Ankzf1 family peptidyl-tRNA hydrolase [Amycolatopsis sp. HUAS 11-8]WAL65375.1 Vms1/Ankzf1 family peptidyl-tRNA hydrolase [Amycolatopsis sp. HUAS 11-8]